MTDPKSAAEALEWAADHAKKMAGADVLWLRERAAELRAQAAASPAPEPVAWAQLGMLNGRTYIREQYNRMPYPPPADVVRNLNLKPLYTVPTADERVALLTVLVWETLNAFSDYAGRGNSVVIALRKRIRAALGDR